MEIISIPNVSGIHILGLNLMIIGHCKDKIKNNTIKSNNAINSSFNFITRKDIPIAYKIKFINSVLIPIATYGCELFGMSEQTTNSIQRIVNKSIRLTMERGKMQLLIDYRMNLE